VTLTLGELFANPDHFLFAFDGDAAVFREMDRDAYRRSIFLDGRIDLAGDRTMRVPLARLLDALPASLPETGWIFHIAHCGSTLLARGLDLGADGLVLREPLALRQLAVEGAQGGTGHPEWNRGLRLELAMLGRRYGEAGPPLVKANVPVNLILETILAARPQAKAVLLHFGLDAYLTAILRSDNHRTWVRSVTQELARALCAELDLDTLDLPDAVRAAALWLAQMRIFARALDRFPDLVSLDADRLFDSTVATVAAAATYFGMAPPDSTALAEMGMNYSKDPGAAFDAGERRQRLAAVRATLAPEIVAANAWVREQLDRCPLPDRLARPLYGENGRLLTPS
jgi:hypothetical protein